MGFLLTRRGIEANSLKTSGSHHNENPTNIKEVQQLIGRPATLSPFLSYAFDKAFLFLPH